MNRGNKYEDPIPKGDEVFERIVKEARPPAGARDMAFEKDPLSVLDGSEMSWKQRLLKMKQINLEESMEYEEFRLMLYNMDVQLDTMERKRKAMLLNTSRMYSGLKRSILYAQYALISRMLLEMKVQAPKSHKVKQQTAIVSNMRRMMASGYIYALVADNPELIKAGLGHKGNMGGVSSNLRYAALMTLIFADTTVFFNAKRIARFIGIKTKKIVTVMKFLKRKGLIESASPNSTLLCLTSKGEVLCGVAKRVMNEYMEQTKKIKHQRINSVSPHAAKKSNPHQRDKYKKFVDRFREHDRDALLRTLETRMKHERRVKLQYQIEMRKDGIDPISRNLILNTPGPKGGRD